MLCSSPFVKFQKAISVQGIFLYIHDVVLVQNYERFQTYPDKKKISLELHYYKAQVKQKFNLV